MSAAADGRAPRGAGRAARLAAACGLAFALMLGTAAAAPGDRQYVTVTDHNPAMLVKALRAGSDFVKAGRGRQFRVVLATAGVIAAIPGSSIIQREMVQLKQSSPGLAIIACRETWDALQQANRRRIPVLPGVSLERCAGLRGKMITGGWQVAPGF